MEKFSKNKLAFGKDKPKTMVVPDYPYGGKDEDRPEDSIRQLAVDLKQTKQKQLPYKSKGYQNKKHNPLGDLWGGDDATKFDTGDILAQGPENWNISNDARGVDELGSYKIGPVEDYPGDKKAPTVKVPKNSNVGKYSVKETTEDFLNRTRNLSTADFVKNMLNEHCGCEKLGPRPIIAYQIGKQMPDPISTVNYLCDVMKENHHILRALVHEAKRQGFLENILDSGMELLRESKISIKESDFDAMHSSDDEDGEQGDHFFSILKTHFRKWHPKTQKLWRSVAGSALSDLAPNSLRPEDEHEMLDKVRNAISRFRNRADDESRKSVDAFVDALHDPSVEPYVADYEGGDGFENEKQDYPWFKPNNPLRRPRTEKEKPVEVEVDVPPPWGEDDYETKIRRGIR